MPDLLKSDILHAIAQAVSRSAEYIECATIFAFTSSGFTAAMISNLFPPQPVIALTPNRKVMNQLSLYRSVYALEITQPGSFNDMMDTVDEMSSRHKLANNGQTVIITGGAPFGSTVSTNFMMFHEVS